MGPLRQPPEEGGEGEAGAAPGGRGGTGGHKFRGSPWGGEAALPWEGTPPLPPPCPGGLPRRLRAPARGNPGTVTPLRRGSENPPSAHPLPGRWSLWIPAPRSPGGMGSVPQPAAPALTHKLICFGLFVLLFLIFYYYYFHALLLFI